MFSSAWSSQITFGRLVVEEGSFFLHAFNLFKCTYHYIDDDLINKSYALIIISSQLWISMDNEKKPVLMHLFYII